MGRTVDPLSVGGLRAPFSSRSCIAVLRLESLADIDALLRSLAGSGH
ncbi:hypothetical protein M2284_003609 [Rhodococcus sp. LBL1]|nr:hypothetical protein [Rhodococcus sp. LBL1]